MQVYHDGCKRCDDKVVQFGGKALESKYTKSQYKKEEPPAPIQGLWPERGALDMLDKRLSLFLFRLELGCAFELALTIPVSLVSVGLAS